MEHDPVAPPQDLGIAIDVAWSIQIFETAASDQASILAALTRDLGDDVLALTSDGQDHFVVVETANDPETIEAVAAIVRRCSADARAVHVSAWPAAAAGPAA